MSINNKLPLRYKYGDISVSEKYKPFRNRSGSSALYNEAIVASVSRGSSSTRFSKSLTSGSIIAGLRVEMITHLARWSNRTVVHETTPIRDER